MRPRRLKDKCTTSLRHLCEGLINSANNQGRRCRVRTPTYVLQRVSWIWTLPDFYSGCTLGSRDRQGKERCKYLAA